MSRPICATQITTVPAKFMAALAGLILLTGCQSAYYDALEKLGIPKRDQLVTRIEKARDAQEDAKEQFQTALEQFSSVVNFDGGNLEDTYERLNDEFEASESKAQLVSDRIDSVEGVAGALFKEWEAELEQYSNSSYRQKSERQLQETRIEYQRLMSAMRRAEAKIEPVISAFRDQVLFLKHNLNARAIASLEGELANVRGDIDRLVREMNVSIDEANSFLSSLEQS